MQGVFSPPEFTQASCSGASQWTTWFDSGNPTLTLGEFEITTHIQQIFAAFMCPVPTGIEVGRVDLHFIIDENISGTYNGRRKSRPNW